METKAMIFAIEAHASTNHTYDNKPYSIHLTMVANIARKYIDIIPAEFQDEVLSACWLHDTIEDCRLTYNDIKKNLEKMLLKLFMLFQMIKVKPEVNVLVTNIMMELEERLGQHL